MVKHLPANAGVTGLIPGGIKLGQEDPWRRKCQPTPVFLPGKFHGQRNLVGYSPWDRKELETTEHLNNAPLHSYLQDFACGTVSFPPGKILNIPQTPQHTLIKPGKYS